MYIHSFITLLTLPPLFSFSSYALHLAHHPRSSSHCQSFHTTFPSSSISSSPSPHTHFIATSPKGSYKTTNNGLELYLQRPEGTIKTKDGVNDKTAEGATVNSTFTLLYGKVTFQVSASVISGVVTAAILIADERDEIDIELLGGDPAHWQTNIFAPSSKDSQPLYGVFGSVEDVPPPNPSIAELHSYSIDWNSEKIVWAVDGKDVRTITREQTRKDGNLHFPQRAARVQLGIWDASNPAGTAEWARGPIDWKKAPDRITAVVRSVNVECVGA